MAASHHLLVADDELDTQAALIQYMDSLGYAVSTASSIKQAEALVARGDVDIALVDVDFLHPGLIAKIKTQQRASGLLESVPEEGAGFALTKWIREKYPDTWVIQMSHHRIYSEDQIEGFSNGADAFFEKTKGPKLAASIVEVALNRRDSRRDPSARFADFCLNYRLRNLVAVNGTVVPLTDAEYRLIEKFVREPNRSLSRDVLHKAAFIDGRHGEWDRAVDTLVLKLRKKMSAVTQEGWSISTIQGLGYRLETDVSYLQST